MTTKRKQFSQYERWAVYQRNGGRCHICGELVDFPKVTVDHVVPLTSGGTDDLTNLMPAHKSCNSSKGGARNKIGYKKDALPHLPGSTNFRLYVFLKRHGLTQAAAATMLGIERGSLNRVLSGKQRITFEFLGRFVSAFGVSPYAEVFMPAEGANCPAEVTS